MAEESKEKQLKMLSAISRIHCGIRANLELEEISRKVVQKLVDIVGCASCAILMIEEEKVRILAQQGYAKALAEGGFDAHGPEIKYVIDTKQSIHRGDITSSPAVGSIPAGCSAKSMVCTPVLINDQAKGIVKLDSPDENAFDEEDFGFVELMAQEMSIAMERASLQSQVQVLTIRDSLTGCFNRKKLDEDLEIEVARARRYHRPLSLLMIVVDWVKKYSDVHGCAARDELLKKMAGICRRNVRMVDGVYRYGGEEFVILLPETAEENALLAVRRIKRTIERESSKGKQEIQPNKKIVVSVGVASYPWSGEDKDELLRAAAFSLYRARQLGRNRKGVFKKAKGVKKAIRSLF
jgi:diguanylate cyclase (GGDEF)-like protein